MIFVDHNFEAYVKKQYDYNGDRYRLHIDQELFFILVNLISLLTALYVPVYFTILTISAITYFVFRLISVLNFVF